MALSLFGEPLPHEDDTAASLIRRTGFPPEGTYSQMPEVYACPCCLRFDGTEEQPTIAEQEAVARKRKLMQFDVIEERAKPIRKHQNNRHRPFLDDDGLIDDVNAPLPPSTVEALNEELKREWASQNPAAKLMVTVHHGKKLSAESRNQLSVCLRCGAFEGQTARVPRGPANLTKWDELFEFPYPNNVAPLEFFVINHALKTKEKMVGGAIVPCDQLHDKKRGIEESVPVMPSEEAGKAVIGTEGPLGTIIVSWYVSPDGSGREVSSGEQQRLKEPLSCNFVAHRLFQYTDNGSTLYSGGVLCVVRDPEDHCSESVLYLPGSQKEPSLSPFYPRTGYHYLPENPSQIMQMNTGRKVGHILVCIPNQKTRGWKPGASPDAEEELLVVGAVPLDFERLHHRGSAVLLVESKSKDDALWGEIAIEWANKSLLEPKKDIPVVSKREALIVTVVRGLNLVRANGQQVDTASVEVATRDMAGATVYAPNVADGDNAYVVHWNQEVRFIGVRSNEKRLEVKVFEDGFPVAVGNCKLSTEDTGAIIVPVYELVDRKKKLGDIVISYKRIHEGQDATKPSEGKGDRGIRYEDDGAEEDEEIEERPTKTKSIKSKGKEGKTTGGVKSKPGKKTKRPPSKSPMPDSVSGEEDEESTESSFSGRSSHGKTPADRTPSIETLSRRSSHGKTPAEKTPPIESLSRRSSHGKTPAEKTPPIESLSRRSSHGKTPAEKTPSRGQSVPETATREPLNDFPKPPKSPRTNKGKLTDDEKKLPKEDPKVDQKMLAKLQKVLENDEKKKRKDILKEEHDDWKNLLKWFKDELKRIKRDKKKPDRGLDNESRSQSRATSRRSSPDTDTGVDDDTPGTPSDSEISNRHRPHKLESEPPSSRTSRSPSTAFGGTSESIRNVPDDTSSDQTDDSGSVLDSDSDTDTDSDSDTDTETESDTDSDTDSTSSDGDKRKLKRKIKGARKGKPEREAKKKRPHPVKKRLPSPQANSSKKPTRPKRKEEKTSKTPTLRRRVTKKTKLEESPPIAERRSFSRKPPVPLASSAPPPHNWWERKEDEFKDPFFPPGAPGATDIHADYEHSRVGQAQQEAIRRLNEQLQWYNVRLSSAQRARRSAQRNRSPSSSPKREQSTSRA